MAVTATKPSKFGKKLYQDWCLISFHACPTDKRGKFRNHEKNEIYSMHVLRQPQTCVEIFFSKIKKNHEKKIPRMFIGHQWFNFSHKKKNLKKSSAQALGTCLALYLY